MDLKPLPQEIIENKRINIRDRILQIRERLNSKEKSHDQKILQKTCIKMGEYLISDENTTAQEMDDIINNLHRSTIVLQKRKQKLQKRKRK